MRLILILLKLLQSRVFQVSATAAQSESESDSVPPPTPEADITPAAPPKPTCKKFYELSINDLGNLISNVCLISYMHLKFLSRAVCVSFSKDVACWDPDHVVSLLQ